MKRIQVSHFKIKINPIDVTSTPLKERHKFESHEMHHPKNLSIKKCNQTKKKLSDNYPS